jgi:hypothetical protein
MPLQPQSGDECFVAANNDHDEKICDHHHIDQSQDGEHDLFLLDVGRLPNQVEEFDNEMIDIYALGDDKPEVKGRLQPAAEEDQAAESILRSCA